MLSHLEEIDVDVEGGHALEEVSGLEHDGRKEADEDDQNDGRFRVALRWALSALALQPEIPVGLREHDRGAGLAECTVGLWDDNREHDRGAGVAECTIGLCTSNRFDIPSGSSLLQHIPYIGTYTPYRTLLTPHHLSLTLIPLAGQSSLGMHRAHRYP